MWCKILVACVACQVSLSRTQFRQIPMSKEFGIYKFGERFGQQGVRRGGRSEEGGNSFQAVVAEVEDENNSMHLKEYAGDDETSKTKEKNETPQERAIEITSEEKSESEERIDESSDHIAVPPVGALLLCSILATQQYVPGFCSGQARGIERPGLKSTCDYYVMRGYLPWFCKSGETDGKGRNGETGEDDKVAMETVLADFLAGGGLFPLIPTKVLSRINETEDSKKGMEELLYNPSFGSLVEMNNQQHDIQSQQRLKNVSGLKLVGGALATGAGLAFLGSIISKPRPGNKYNSHNQQNYYQPSQQNSYHPPQYRPSGVYQHQSSYQPYQTTKPYNYGYQSYNAYQPHTAYRPQYQNVYPAHNGYQSNNGYQSHNGYQSNIGFQSHNGYQNQNNYQPHNTYQSQNGFQTPSVHHSSRTDPSQPFFQGCFQGHCGSKYVSKQNTTQPPPGCNPNLYFYFGNNKYFICEGQIIQGTKDEEQVENDDRRKRRETTESEPLNLKENEITNEKFSETNLPEEKKLKFGGLLAGGLGLAAGSYLANTYSNKRPVHYNYRPGYNNWNNGYQGSAYSPYYSRPSYPYKTSGYFQRSNLEEDELENLNEYSSIDGRSNYAGNQQRGTFGKLVLGGLGLAAGHHIANKYFQNKKPNYSQQGYQGYQVPVYNPYSNHYQPRPQHGYKPQNGYHSQNGYSSQNSFRPQNGYHSQNTFRPQNGHQSQNGYKYQNGHQSHNNYQSQNGYKSQNGYQSYNQFKPQNVSYSYKQSGHFQRSAFEEDESGKDIESQIMENEDLYSDSIVEIILPEAEGRGKFGGLVAGGLGLAAGYYLANKRPSYGHRYTQSQYRPGYGYSSRPVYGRPPHRYGYSSRPVYNYRSALPDEESDDIPSMQERTEYEIMENEDLYSGNIVAIPSHYGVNQQRGKFGKLVLGGFGLASGYYLANKLSQNKRPNYNQGYSPYQPGYQSYKRPVYQYRPGGYGSFRPYSPYQRSDQPDFEALLAKLLAKKASGSRFTGSGNHAVYEHAPFYHGPPATYQDLMRTYNIANIIESEQLASDVDYSNVTEEDFGCIPIYSYSLGGVPYYRCKGQQGSPYIQNLDFNATPYGWSVPFVSNGLGAAVDAYVPLGSL